MKKFVLTKNKKDWFGTTLFQIKALVSFGNVSKGELGGWIEKESNLSQTGDAWVSGDARVYGDAQVSGNARVYGNAWVSGDAQVSGNAQVSGDAWVYGKVKIDFALCSRFNFGFAWQVKLWQELEKEFEAKVKKKLGEEKK